jgi:hypothetical protein
MMQVFNATINLEGNFANAVARRGLTTPEIYVLRRLHGDDAVIKIEHVGYADVDSADERERLDYEYGAGLANLTGDAKTSIEKMFGGDFAPLIEELRGYNGKLVDREDDLFTFQQPEPFASPIAEDKGTLIRKRAMEKAAAKKAVPEDPKDFTPAAKPKKQKPAAEPKKQKPAAEPKIAAAAIRSSSPDPLENVL